MSTFIKLPIILQKNYDNFTFRKGIQLVVNVKIEVAGELLKLDGTEMGKESILTILTNLGSFRNFITR